LREVDAHTRLLGVLAATCFPLGRGIDAVQPFFSWRALVHDRALRARDPRPRLRSHRARTHRCRRMEALCLDSAFGADSIHQLSATVADLRLDLLRNGLGLFGSLGIAAASAMGIGVYAFQVLLSRWWLRRFRFGRWNGCGAPSCTGQSSRCASVRLKDQKPALETGFLPSSIAP
jgi:Protein of unknown function (DUF418)